MPSAARAGLLLTCLLTLAAIAPRDASAALRARGAVTPADIQNPSPMDDDILLPLPGGLKMAFRLVTVEAGHLLADRRLRPGRNDAANPDRAFYDRRFETAISAPFTAADLPGGWVPADLAGDGRFFYLVAKYEVSRGQWRAVMEEGFSPESLKEDDARPVTDITWYDAMEFTRRCTAWMLANAPDALPRSADDGRSRGFLRLPTEAEWEYAARGGHMVGGRQLLHEDFFPLPEDGRLTDYAVFRPRDGSDMPDGPARIGSRRPNPLGLFDTAGNVAEMTMDVFRFSVGGQLHGSAGGFVRKGGSFFSDDDAVMPGRRDEAAFFLGDGPAHARDLGFRPVLAGVNVPSAARLERLAGTWRKLGEEAPAAAKSGGNPLEEIDTLLNGALPDAVRIRLQNLRTTIKEGNIATERERLREAESVLMTAAYTIDGIRALKREIGRTELDLEAHDDRVEMRRKKLEAWKAARAEWEKTLRNLRNGLGFRLGFYRETMEKMHGLDGKIFADAMRDARKSFSGGQQFHANMRRALDVMERHWTDRKAWFALDDKALFQELTQRK